MVAIKALGRPIGASWRSTTANRIRPADAAGERRRVAISSLAMPWQRLELVREHGDFTLAYGTAVQPGLQYFGDEHGYISYDCRWGYTFVLGDPVAAPQDRERLIQKFVAQRPRVAFCQISPTTAQIV